jgi:hypothetical protein
VKDFNYYCTESITGAEQYRGRFTHQNEFYDFPITDLDFISRENEKANQFTEKQAYLTLSLGEIFRGYCYKLIAGVIIL